MNKKILAIVGMAFSCNAYCDLYFGATVGQSDSGDPGSASDLTWFAYTNVTSDKTDNKDTAYSVYFGYEFELQALSLGLEAGWIDFGKNKLTAEGQDFAPVGDGKRTAVINSNADAITLSARLTKPIAKDFSVFGKLGVASWKISADLDGEVYNASGTKTGSISTSASDTGRDPFIGLGIGYKFLRIGFDRYRINDSDTDYLYFGVQF